MAYPTSPCRMRNFSLPWKKYFPHVIEYVVHEGDALHYRQRYGISRKKTMICPINSSSVAVTCNYLEPCELEHQLLGAGILEADGCLGIYTAARNLLYPAHAKTLVLDDGARPHVVRLRRRGRRHAGRGIHPDKPPCRRGDA